MKRIRHCFQRGLMQRLKCRCLSFRVCDHTMSVKELQKLFFFEIDVTWKDTDQKREATNINVTHTTNSNDIRMQKDQFANLINIFASSKARRLDFVYKWRTEVSQSVVFSYFACVCTVCRVYTVCALLYEYNTFSKLTDSYSQDMTLFINFYMLLFYLWLTIG